MSYRYLAIGAFLFLLVSIASAQVEYSVGNFLRYGNGRQLIGGTPQNFEYFENQTDVRLFWSDFTIGMQYLHDNPPEFGTDTTGIRKRYVEFSREGLDLRAGDFFTLFGKGLSMNLYEDRGLNYYTGLDGLRGSYRNKHVNAILATGRLRYYDLVEPTRFETYSVKGMHAEVTPVKAVRIGGSLIGVKGELPSVFGIDNVDAEIREGMITLRSFGFDLHASYVKKISSIHSPQATGSIVSYEHSGDGLYGSLGYAGSSGLGITIEYKDYRFDPLHADDPVNSNRPTRMLPIQNPPIVHKEHSFNLLSRNPHIIDFNDEIGMQIDAYYSLTDKITLNLNAAASSKHRKYRLLANDRHRVVDSVSFFPSFDTEFSPFYELYAEVEWYFEGQSFVRAAFNRRYDVTAVDYLQSGMSAHIQSSTTIPLMVEYILSDEYSMEVIFEQQFYHDSSFKPKSSFFNEYVTLTLAGAPDWSATVRLEGTTDETDLTFRKVFNLFGQVQQFWSTAEFSYRIANSHTATLSYGTERGGLVCSSGICRIVNPFDGIRFSLLSQL